MSLSSSPASPPEPGAAAVDSSGRFSGAVDLVVSIAFSYGLLFIALFLFLGLVVASEFVSNRRRRHREEEQYEPRKVEVAMAAMQVPTVLFSAAATKLNGFAAECSICLAEFSEGDVLRVLPACSHGFHRQCVERWLVAKRTCPNCRRACGGEQPHCPPDDEMPV